MDKTTNDMIARQLQCLDETEFNRPDLSPWVRENREPYEAGNRDAFIGNGFLGLRVPMEGEPSVYPLFHAVKMAPGGTEMYGLWDNEGRLPVFNFLGLKLSHGRMVFRRDSGAILNYRQTLDWRTATMTTECDWAHWGGIVHILTTIYLSRTQKHLGVVKMELTADYDTTFALTDRVDGTFLPGLADPQCYLRSSGAIPKAFYGKLGGRLLAAATAVSVNGVPQPGDVTLNDKLLERVIYCPVKKGVPVRIVKCGAIYSDLDTSDPVQTATTAATFALEEEARLRQQHEQAWSALWENRIEVGHPGVQMLLNNAVYQLYCSLDETATSGVPGPCGLSGSAWQGHIFWDADTWTLPPAAILNPSMAKNYVQYRIDTLPGARRNAAAMGLPGARFAWESGASGDELIPGLVYCRELHLTADIAFAIWKYYLASGDEATMRHGGLEVIRACADFFSAYAVHNAEKDRYEIRGVSCADEFSGVVDNNAFTNYGAAVTLRLAAKLSRQFGMDVAPQWETIADKLWIPLDESRKLVIEYEGYDGGTIKQADAVMVFYPLEIPLANEYRRNTNAYYLVRYPQQKIMMSSVIHGILSAWDGDLSASWRMFLDLLPHFRGKYLLVSETPVNETSSLLTGLCGMLQLVLMGWGGLHLTEQGLTATPAIPAELGFLRILGIHSQGQRYELHATQEHFTLIPTPKTEN